MPRCGMALPGDDSGSFRSLSAPLKRQNLKNLPLPAELIT
jgi:hypothetical protein